MDLFKEYDSSSSEEGENAGRHQDDMLFESNNLIPLSKFYSILIDQYLSSHEL